MAQTAIIPNLGLSTRFQLSDTGQFMMTGGLEKVDDNVTMLVRFMGWFRLFGQDFCLNPHRFYQNNTNYLNKFKDLFRLEAMTAGQKYCPYTDFYAVDVVTNPKNRRQTLFYIQYRYKTQPTAAPSTIVSLIV